VRVALVADGIGGMHGVTHTLDEIRERGVPGFEVEVIGTDPQRRPPPERGRRGRHPFYAGLKVGVPSLPASSRRWPRAATSSCTSARPARRVRRGADRPRHGPADHRQLPHRADRLHGAALGRRRARGGCRGRAGRVLRRLRHVLSPSEVSDGRLRALGFDDAKIGRWDRGVDLDRFSPTLRTRAADGRVRVLYAAA
jgi:hypothetical protein